MKLYQFSSCINMVTIPLLLTLLALQFASGEETSIVNITKEQIKDIGEEVEFNCTVKNPNKYPVIWLKLGKNRQNYYFLTTNENLVIKNPKFSLVEDKERSTYSLKIKALEESNTGFYRCQILINYDNTVNSDVELQIRRPAAITNATVISNNTSEGQPIELHCNADGYPVPRISWKREDDTLLSIGGSVFIGSILKIPKTHRDDRGTYFCIAENGVGKEAVANVTITINFSPIVTAVRPRVGQAQGYEVNLECEIEAHPSPKITWLKNGKEIRRDDSSKKPVDFIDRYTINSVESSDYDIYVCKAENDLGASDTKIELFETSIPVCIMSSCG